MSSATILSSSSEDSLPAVVIEEEEERFFTIPDCSLNFGNIPPPSFGSYNCFPPSRCHRSIFISISFGSVLLPLNFSTEEEEEEEAFPPPPRKFPTNEYPNIVQLAHTKQNNAMNSRLLEHECADCEEVTSARTRNDSIFVWKNNRILRTTLLNDDDRFLLRR